MTTLAIDPGANTGWAIWDDGQLRGCGLGIESLIAHLGKDSYAYTQWKAVYEHPEYQPARRVNPNDIITLAVRCGVVLGRLRERYCFSWHAVKPSEWKGSVPKKTHQTRFIKTLATENLRKLEAELANHSKKDDVVDAVALAAWYERKTNCARSK